MTDRTHEIDPGSPTSRLAPLENQTRPWRRAKQMTQCSLYWAPVHSFPVSLEQRQWFLKFFDQLIALLGQEGLGPEIFLQLKTIQPALNDAFHGSALDFLPIAGLGRRPAGALPAKLTEDDVKKMQAGKKKFEMDEYLGDYCYWFLNKAERKQRELFFGHGGMTMIFVKPDKKTQPPAFRIPTAISSHPFFQQVDLSRMMACSASMTDGFTAKSKELFGKGLESLPQYRGLLFILPLLASKDFFSEGAEVPKWFELCDVYVNESPADNGILLAAKNDIEEQIVGIVKQMRDQGMEYPER